MITDIYTDDCCKSEKLNLFPRKAIKYSVNKNRFAGCKMYMKHVCLKDTNPTYYRK